MIRPLAVQVEKEEIVDKHHSYIDSREKFTSLSDHRLSAISRVISVEGRSLEAEVK